MNSSEEKYLDSVYFGVAVDNDIGNYATDFTGSDTLLNSAFAYKKNQDNYFGDNPPSIMTTLLQGPIVEDEFSEATIKRGPYLGEEIFSLSSNKEMTAAASYLRAANSKPTNKYEVYNYLKGLNLLRINFKFPKKLMK